MFRKIFEYGRQKIELSFKNKVAWETMLLIAVLVIVGFLLHGRTVLLLNDAIEETVARQTADFSLLAEERFARELSELAYAADIITTEKENETTIRRTEELLAKHAPKGVTHGFLKINVGAVFGENLSATKFNELAKAFGGSRIVDFKDDKGLLFAVPLRSGDNVRGVLWRLYNGEQAVQLFPLFLPDTPCVHDPKRSCGSKENDDRYEDISRITHAFCSFISRSILALISSACA